MVNLNLFSHFLSSGAAKQATQSQHKPNRDLSILSKRSGDGDWSIQVVITDEWS